MERHAPRASSSDVGHPFPEHGADTRSSAGSGPSRVFYRNEEEFKKAISKAAERLRDSRKDDWLHAVIGISWLATVVVGIAAIAVAALDVPILEDLVENTRLIRIAIVVFVLLTIAHELVLRSTAPEVIAKRLCFQCIRPLRDVPTDESGYGVCSRCGRPFNTAEYEHPDTRIGAEFSGYLDDKHFRAAIRSAAVRIHSLTFMPVERRFLDSMFIVLIVALLGDVLLDLYEIRWPNDIPIAASIGFPAWGLWCAWYWWRVQRIESRIVRDRLCLDCGYSLVGTTFDPETQLGRCPECGRVVHAREYEPPQPPDSTTDDHASDA